MQTAKVLSSTSSTSTPRHRPNLAWPLLLGAVFLAASVRAQAPPLLCSTNLGAQVFAVDEQTNVYAQAGGAVVKLSGSGVPLQTNVLSLLPGTARRDAAGNFYYAGVYPGTPIPPYVQYNEPAY